MLGNLLTQTGGGNKRFLEEGQAVLSVTRGDFSSPKMGGGKVGLFKFTIPWPRKKIQMGDDRGGAPNCHESRLGV